MKLPFLIILILNIFASSSSEIIACCKGNGDLDLYEFLSKDLVAEVEVVGFEVDYEHIKYISTSKVIRDFKSSGLNGKTITIISNTNYLGVPLTPGKYFVWLDFDAQEGLYRINQCNRILPSSYQGQKLKDEPHFINYQKKRKEMVEYLENILATNGPIDEIADDIKTTGNLENGMPVGTWKVINQKNSLVYTMTYKNGLKHGTHYRHKLNHPEAKSFFNYKNGLLEGVSQERFPNGALRKSTTYKNGIANGPEINYQWGGAVSNQGNKINGVKEGLWEYFGMKNRLKKQIIYTIVPDKIPDPKLNLDNYVLREILFYNSHQKLIRKTAYHFQEKILEEVY